MRGEPGRLRLRRKPPEAQSSKFKAQGKFQDRKVHSRSAPRRQDERCGGCGRGRDACTTGSGRDVPIHAGGVPDGSRRSPPRGDLRFGGPSRRHPGGGARGPGSRRLASLRDAIAGTRPPPGVSLAHSLDPRLPSGTPPAWVCAPRPSSGIAPSAQSPMSAICGESKPEGFSADCEHRGLGE